MFANDSRCFLVVYLMVQNSMRKFYLKAESKPLHLQAVHELHTRKRPTLSTSDGFLSRSGKEAGEAGVLQNAQATEHLQLFIV